MSNTTRKSPILTQRGIPEGSGRVPGQLTFSVNQEDELVTLYVEVPGVDPETIDMEAFSDAIRVSCDRGEMNYPVEASLDLSKVDVSVRWGMLEIVIPRRQSRAVKIKIAEK